ncbi:MAG: ferredoxin--NADP reductase [Rhodoferax sp.]|nr:ferredoxin--NADP reductase [Rhodoferax sp.]
MPLLRTLRTLNTLRRDVAQLALQTVGLKKARVGAGKPVLYAKAVPAQSAVSPFALHVVDVVRETADAISIVAIPADGQPIRFQPGMFLTLIITIDLQEYRRAYSISSSAQEDSVVVITVKRVPDGKVSNWLNDHISPGSTLRVLGPSGSLPSPLAPLPQGEGKEARTLLLVAGGSGITPLMSIARTVLAVEPQTRIHLLYGNRSMGDIIFHAALRDLKKRYVKRMALTHVLEQPPKGWKGWVGRLDRAMFASLLDAILVNTAIAAIADLEVYTCGPAPLMQGVWEEVLARGLPAGRFHQENFTPAVAATDSSRFATQTLAIQSQGKTWSGLVPAGQTLLEAGLSLGAPMLFSCTLGGCGSCRVQVTDGEVEMPEPNCLSSEEKAQRYALACIARPCSPVRIDIPH